MSIPKTFTAGERLFAADLNDNFVASDAQGVRVFANAAARTTAIPAPAEGMLTFNKDTGQLEVFDGTNFVVAAPEPPAGIGSNVVSATTGTAFVVSSTTPSNVPGLVISFTPTSASSKVLLIAKLSMSGLTTNHYSRARLARNGTEIPSGIFDDVVTRVATTATSVPASLLVLDEPETTSSVTYSVQIMNQGGGGTVLLNRDGASANNSGRSTIVAIEVAA